MLYFCFNTDNFIVQNECDDKGSIDLALVKEIFLNKLSEESSLPGTMYGNAFCDELDIPVDAFGVNEESMRNVESIIKFVIFEYAKRPIVELNNKSLVDLGINIEFCKRILNEEINAIINESMCKNNEMFVMEEVLWKNLSKEEKINTFCKKFIEIKVKDKELIIVDPYIFSDKDDEYCSMLGSVLEKSKAKTIIIVTDEKNYKNESFKKIKEIANIKMDVKYNNSFHDRFWISDRKKGFYTGTSFNGIGKKISLINMLKDTDVKEIVHALKKESLI